MAKINHPVMFERVAAAFDADVALSRTKKLCSESSGSEHSAVDLSDLVMSFMEENERDDKEEYVEEVVGDDEDGEKEEEVEKPVCKKRSDTEKKEMLRSLFAAAGDDEDDENCKVAKETIRGEVELALLGRILDVSSTGFKRNLMSSLREKGFDAGLCKTKWEKRGKLTAGDYEYIDVNFSGKRYIVEVSLASEFEIARPTDQFSSLLHVIPLIFVGEVEELNQVVRFMSSAIKSSMKRKDLHIPPWRRSEYMQAKWFSSYKRTTNAVAKGNGFSHLFPKRSIGFEATRAPVKEYNCRDDFDYVGSNIGFRIGHLTAALNADS